MPSQAEDLVDWHGVSPWELARERLTDPRLTDKAMRTAHLIAGFPRGSCWFSVEALAAVLHCAPSTARAALQLLEELGISRRIERPGQTSIHELIPSPRAYPTGQPVGYPAGGPAPKALTVNSDLRAAQEACQDLSATLAALDGGSPVELSVSQAQPENEQSVSGDVVDEPPSPPLARAALASSRPAKARSAPLSQPTLLALIASLGTGQVRALEGIFCHSRWRAPGSAEAACRILLQRMQRKRINHPLQYVETLYADALERAPQCAELLERERRVSLSPRRGPDVSTA